MSDAGLSSDDDGDATIEDSDEVHCYNIMVVQIMFWLIMFLSYHTTRWACPIAVARATANIAQEQELNEILMATDLEEARRLLHELF